MKLTVIITFYNSEQTIHRALDCIYNQTINDFNIMIVNDGSTDKTKEIIDEYTMNKAHTQVIHQDNHGCGGARNGGIKQCTTEYLMFMDGDDVIEPHTIETIYKHLDNQDLLSFNLDYVDEQGKVLSKPNRPSFNNMKGEDALVKMILSKELFITAVGYVYKRSLFNNRLFKERMYHEDYGMTPIMIASSNQVIAIEDCLYHYIQTETSMVRGIDEEKKYIQAKDVLVHYNWLMEQLSQLDINEANLKIIKSFLANALILKVFELKDPYLKEMVTILSDMDITSQLLNQTLKNHVKLLLVKRKIRKAM